MLIPTAAASSLGFDRVFRHFGWVFVGLLTALASDVYGQDGQFTGFQRQSFVIQDANVIVRPAEELKEADILIQDGVIRAVGQDLKVPADAEVISGKGLFVYAGFIDAGTTQLLDTEQKPKPAPGQPWDSARYVLAATKPDNRKGLTPEYQAAEHLKLESAKLEELRKAGFVALHVLPDEGLACGQGSLVSTGGQTPREVVMVPSTMTSFCIRALGGEGYPSTLMGGTAHLRQAFLDARHNAKHLDLFRESKNAIARPPVDPTLEILQDVLESKRRSLFLANTKDHIHRALDFSQEHNLKPILWDASDAHRCLDRLADGKTDLILNLNFGEMPKIEPSSNDKKLTADVKDPLRVQEDRQAKWLDRVKGIAEIQKRGLRFGVSSRALKSPADVLASMRTLIKQGLPKDAALAAVTTNPAAILGVSDRLGTLEAGKLGSVIVLTKPFDDAETKVRYVFVDGRHFEYNADAKPSSDKPQSQHPAIAERPLLGTWKLTIQTPAKPTTATVNLTQDGNKLGGTFRSSVGNGNVTSASIQNDKIEFAVRFGGSNDAVEFRFTGERKGEELSGEMRSPFAGATNWTAIREETPASKEPAKPAIAQRDSESEWPTELDRDRLTRPFQTGGDVLIQNATILTGTGETLDGASLLIRQGKIAAIGKDLKPDPGMKVIDATDRFVMPGIIDTHSHIMITDGINEATLSIVPEVRVKDVLNTEDPSEYRALAGGVTAARIFHGSANVIGGQDATIKLKHGKTAKEHIIPDAPQGIKFALGENVKFRSARFPNTRLGVEATLNRAFMEALDYRRKWTEYEKNAADKTLLPPRRDLRLEALADIVNHKKFIHSHCYRADEILMLLRTADQLGIRVWSLQHVLEGYKIAPEIAAHGASCSTFADWWAYKVEAYDATPYNAALLNEAGVNVVIKSDDPELIRHLYHEAAKTVRYGNMPLEEAIKTVTLNPAKELGLDDRIGSLEVAKDGDLAIYNAHPLSSFARCEMTLIEGEVYFTRENAPTAMSLEAKARSAKPPAIAIPSLSARNRNLDLAEVSHGRYALTGATLYPVDAPIIPNGTLLVENGRITALGKDLQIPTGSQVIDCAGMHIAPGFIDAGTQLGLIEIGKVRETQDFAEGGQFQPDLRAGVGLNVDSELIPVARSGGITTIMIRPSGGVISGQASIAQLAGWTAPEMVKDYEAGMQISWPSEKNQQEELHDFLEEARVYDRLQSEAEKQNRPGPITDPRFESLRPYLNRKKPVFMEAHSRKAIAESLLFAEKEKLDIIITGGTEAWKLADELKQRNVPIIVGPVIRNPLSNTDPSDAPYANPGRLFDAGVKFCIRSDNAANSRNAPLESAMAVAYGLPKDEGLKAVTLSAAEILGIENEVGSLTPKKSANLVILDGDPLEHTSNIKGVFIAGKPFAPDSRQIRFYNRYRERLAEKKPTTVPTSGESKAVAE